MELTVASRTAGKKSDSKKLRREDKIPAILYSKGEKGTEIAVDENAFKKILNKIEKGTLSSKVFELKLDDKTIKALVKDIQYAVTTYRILHIDFEEIFEDRPVTLNIPVQCTNVIECVGIKLGGVLRQLIRHVRVTCLPKDIPDCFELDVGPLNMGQSLKLNTLTMPSGVQAKMDLKEVAVLIARK